MIINYSKSASENLLTYFIKRYLPKQSVGLSILFLLIGVQIGFSQSPYTDNTPGASSFTVPAGVTSVTISLWGAGGAGGGSTTNTQGGSGGGSGGYTTRTFTGLTAGQIINYTTGTGGTGSTGNGTNGTLSTLTFSGFTLTANGGTGGQSNQGAIGNGGTATGGTTNTTGANGITGTTSGGDGGNAPAGGGTGGTGNTNSNGGDGNVPGGGGGGGERANTGGSRDRSGGDGGNGGISITFTCPTFSAGTNQTLATCATTATLAATAATAPATGVWTVVSGSGTVTTPTSPTSGVTGIVPGTPLVLRWTVTNGSCGSTNTTVTITSPAGPGCISYCASNATSTIDSMISNVTFNTINNTTSACAAYTDFTSISTTVTKLSSYNLTIAKNDCDGGTNFSGRFAAWIDWNQNGTFEAGEQVLADAAASVGPITVSVTVPAGALTGTTRMRCIFNESAAPSACGTYNWGETEDYTVNIIPAPACVAPTAQPTALALTPGGTTINGSFVASVPTSDNYLVVMNTTGTPPTNPVNGTSYVIGGTLGAGNIIVDNDTNTTFTATGLTATTTYYFFIYSFNSACTGGPLYLTTGPLTGNTTTVLSYCTAGGNSTASSWISNVTLNTIDKNTAAWAGYTDYYPTTGTDVTRTITYTVSVTIYNATTSQKNISAWVDWNKNGVFDVATETILSTTSTVASAQFVTLTNTFTVPAGAVVSDTRMRVELAFNSEGAATPCNTNTLTDVQDYKVNVKAIFACTTPTTQPTGLMLTPSGTTIGGSFAPAVPNPTNYLVVMNTTGIAPIPAPANGTTYTIGGTLGIGNTIIDTDNNTSFVATGLTTTTTYYFFIYSYNSLCTGGPLYNTTSPLTGTTTTTSADPIYCTPSVGAGFESLVYFNNISFVGTLNDISNTSSYSSAPRGYQDFSAIANRSRQAQGQGVNIAMQMSSRGYVKAWVDWNRDGDFIDAGETVYDTGGIATYSTTFGFIIPAAQPLGNYRVRIRINKDDNVAPYDANAISTFGSCGNIDYYGETEDYTFTVVASCSAIITGVTDGVTCGPGTVNLAATSSGGATQYRWYTTELGGTPLATTATGTWTTPSISTTTTYWVTSFNGCESLVRTKVTARVNPLATISFTPSVPEICGENQVLSLTASGDVQQTYLVDEKFDSGLGVCSNVNIVSNGAATDAISQWQRRTSTFVPAQQVWFPAIASGLNGNGYAMATSDVGSVVTHNAILTPTVNTNTYLDLTLSFDIFYSRYYVDNSNPTLDYVTVDISTDGGTAWTEIDRYIADIGYGTRFVNKNYNFNAYINQPNFRVRVRYYGEWCDGLAIDNLQLYGNVPLNTSFNWTSGSPVAAYTDAACTIPYVTGTPITTVFVKPTLAQLETPTYSFTATATLSNGCSVSQNVSINNKTSVWKGTSSNDWNNPNNWLPVGVPTINTCVIIPDVTSTNPSKVLGASYNAFGRTLQVKNLGNLQIQPTNTLTIQDYVDVTTGGTFDIENSASLIQINNVANTGIINMKRNAVTNNTLDYVYWSTPVAAFSVNNITPASVFRYLWNPTTVTGYASNFGNWAGASGAMTTGRGYIIRGSSGTSTFIGTPNNGNITTPITRSTYTGATYTGPTSTQVTSDDDNWNLLGNPYPSAISADDFLAANSANLNQFVKIWTHGIDPSAAIADPFYQDYLLNYSTADYITYNALGGTQFGYDGKIGAGQGFFVLMNDANSTSENAIFNNTMRSNTHRNDQFYRTENEVEKHRIWLTIGSPTNASVSTLVGYTTEASNNLDNKYDAIAQGVKTNFELYSIAESQELIIQGRSLPFNQNDEVILGVAIPQNGIYTIAISNVDGLFSDTAQNIYLEDKQLGIFHDLRTAPYTFTGTVGRDENRFVLLYNSSRLSQDDVTLENNLTVVTNDNVTLYSSNENINSIEVYDLLGKVVQKYNNINSKEFMLSHLTKNNTTLLLKVKLNNGVIVNKKVIF